jgi:hypothetical protein
MPSIAGDLNARRVTTCVVAVSGVSVGKPCTVRVVGRAWWGRGRSVAREADVGVGWRLDLRNDRL